MMHGKELGAHKEYSNPVEFPIPSDRIVLFDLDETLIDRKYSVTDDAIYDAVGRAQEEGWQLGLNSDSSLETLRQFSDHFAFNGPIVAERGAIVEIDGEVFTNNDDLASFGTAKDAMEQRLNELGVAVWSGDPSPALREGLRVGERGDIVVLVNAYRRSSIGLYFRSVNDSGELMIDPSVTDMLAGEMREFYPELSGLYEDLNHDYGVLILSRQEMVKRIGTQSLMQQGGYAQIGMVGNALTDYVGGDIALHYAVGNAKEEYKEQASYISDYPYTTGAVDILQRLAGIL